MPTHRFDALTQSLATRFTLRQAVHATGLGLAVGAARLGPAQSTAQGTPTAPVPETTPPVEAPERTYFLFVQTFGAGTLLPHVPAPTMCTLTLTGHAAETIYFSDRPERIVGSVPTPQSLEGLGFTPDNPPNAALVAGEQVVVLELFNPVYEETFGDEGTVTLTYDVAVLDDYAEEGLAHLAQQAGGDLPETLESASLFIDDCSDAPVSCLVDNQAVAAIEVSRCVNIAGRCTLCGGLDSVLSSAARQCNATYPAVCRGRCQAFPE